MYTVDYFIDKFSKIPEGLWFVGDYYDRNGDGQCARGHCGKRVCKESEEDEALLQLFDFSQNNSYVNSTCIANINDGNDYRYPQLTPKQRVLAALYDVKKAQYPQISDPPITADELIESLEPATIL